MNNPPSLTLRFDGGTVVVSGGPADFMNGLPGVQFDERTRSHRAEGHAYRLLVEHLRAHKIGYTDEARAWNATPWPLKQEREAFPHQIEALDHWWTERAQGVVVLPTGTGKTYLAVLAIAKAARPALIVTPTIDLMAQWAGELESAFGVPIGLLGGGSFEIQPITVTTYDSAYIHLDRWGNRFGLLIFDECHHLPGPTYLTAAVGALAPFRLGLTATPERADGLDGLLSSLIGPIVYRREIKELAGDFLADYETRRCYVELSTEEQQQYQEARDRYRRFVEDNGISMGGANGWQRFLRESCRSAEGRLAFRAYRLQKRLSQAASGKLQQLDKLLEQHARDRVLIFTYDNATVYLIARRLLVPAITHQTKTKERKRILERFHSGEYPVVVTSQVLNEGVNVPAANVGIILSGTGSVREHVQRLGRLLRKHADKRTVLYEIIARGTAEEFTSERRRQHDAYR